MSPPDSAAATTTNSLWTGLPFLDGTTEGPLPLSPRLSLAETISQSLLSDFPCLYTVTTPERLRTKLDVLIQTHSTFGEIGGGEDYVNQLLFTTDLPKSSIYPRGASSTRKYRGLPPRLPSNDGATVASSSSASRFLSDLAPGLPLTRPVASKSQLWSLQEDATTLSPFSSMSFTSGMGAAAREKLTSYQRRARFVASIPTTVGESSLDYGGTNTQVLTPRPPPDDIAKTIIPGDSMWRTNPNIDNLSERPDDEQDDAEPLKSHRPVRWLDDLTRTTKEADLLEAPVDFPFDQPNTPDYLFTGGDDLSPATDFPIPRSVPAFADTAFSAREDRLGRGLEVLLEASRHHQRRRPLQVSPTPPRRSTQVFCHMLAALRDRERGMNHNHHHHHHHHTNVSCPATVSTLGVPGGYRGTSSPLLSTPLTRVASPISGGTRSPSGSQRGGFNTLKGYVDDRERMVFVSWIPKRTRSYNSHEKRRLELDLKAKLKDALKINGVSKVLLFPPKGAHCKIIFQSRGCASEFMRRYGGDQGSVATERWKRDICRAFDIEMTERFQPTVVKIEWAQK